MKTKQRKHRHSSSRNSGILISGLQNATLTITDMVYQGKGLARLDGCVVFVPYVLPQEIVHVQLTARKKNYAEARLLEVVEASPFRIRPVCPLAGRCPGCRYQHVEYSEEIRLKQSQFHNLLSREAKVDPSSVCMPTISSQNHLEYRNRIRLHGAVAGRNVTLGYYGEDNETVIDVDHCALALPHINKLLKLLRRDRRFMSSVNGREDVVLRYTQKDGPMCWMGKLKPGQPFLTEASDIGELHVPRDSFFQVNAGVTDRLVEQVRGAVDRVQPSCAIDLYCGVGVFALIAGMLQVERVIGIDSDPEAIRAATMNAAARRLHKVQFVAADVGKVLRPVLKQFNSKRTALIVDPPRSGMEKSVVEAIKQAKPSDIVYISCAPDTLARDIALLKEARYDVVNTRILDMFPRTAHFETVTTLSRG